MNIVSSNLSARLSRWSSYIPIQATALAIFAIGATLFWIVSQNQFKENDFQPLLLLLLKIAFVSIAIIVACGITLTILSYLIFRYWLKHKKTSVQLKVTSTKDLILEIPKILLPLLGTLKLKLDYEPDQQTRKFSIGKLLYSKGWPIRNIHAELPVDLHHIKDYRLMGGILYFEDVLQLVTIPLSFKTSIAYTHFPPKETMTLPRYLPQVENETHNRIPELRKINGDWLDYKKFDQGDDTRRIIWKVFAKNRELIVRKIETRNPFASEYNVYINFDNLLLKDHYDDFLEEMLNHYKTKVLALYEGLQMQNISINYYIDSTAHVTAKKDEQIINSNWNPQSSSALLPKQIHFAVFHSLSDTRRMREVLHLMKPNDATTAFVHLETPFKTSIAGSLLKRIFLLPPESPIQHLQDKWWYSPIKRKLKQQQETVLQELTSFKPIDIEV